MLEVGEHEDVKELGAGSWTKGVEACPEPAFEFIGSHARRLRLEPSPCVSALEA
jgi:hypothetical protein